MSSLTRVYRKIGQTVFLVAALFTITLDAYGENEGSADEPKTSKPVAVPQLVEVRRIWDRAAHNAFTDLLRHEGRWYCVFREGSKHVSPDGSLRVITSEDGNDWKSLALISHQTDDLRDAKLSVTPGGRFMLNGAGMQADKPIRYHSMVWFSDDKGQTWDNGRRHQLRRDGATRRPAVDQLLFLARRKDEHLSGQSETVASSGCLILRLTVRIVQELFQSQP